MKPVHSFTEAKAARLAARSAAAQVKKPAAPAAQPPKKGAVK